MSSSLNIQQAKIEAELKEFRSLQKQISNLANSRSQYLTQLNENEMVKKELELLETDAEIFKLVGPVLIKQERTEATANVLKRIDFISGELKKIEATAKETGDKQEKQKQKIIDLQQQIQSQK